MFKSIMAWPQRLRNIMRNIYRFICGIPHATRVLWLRNLLVISIVISTLIIGIGIGLSIGRASASSQSETSFEVPKQEAFTQSVSENGHNSWSERSDWESSTTTTTTIVPPPPKKSYKASETITTNVRVLPAPSHTPEEIEAFIREQAPLHGLDVERMVRIGSCESGFHSNSINFKYTAGGGHPSGVYQFLPSTWDNMAAASGLGGDVFDGKQNVLVAMWGFSHGQAGQWACK